VVCPGRFGLGASVSERPLLTFYEAAQMLDCSLKTLRRRIDAGLLPVYRDGRIVRVRRVDVDEYIAARTAFVTAPEAHGGSGRVIRLSELSAEATTARHPRH
jgi:excisionase family DNA binding protein